MEAPPAPAVVELVTPLAQGRTAEEKAKASIAKSAARERRKAVAAADIRPTFGFITRNR